MSKMTDKDLVHVLCMFLELMEDRDWDTYERTALCNRVAFRRLSKFTSRCEDFCGMTLLHAVVRHEPPNNVLKQMIEFYPEALTATDCLGRRPLHIAAGCGANEEIIRQLVAAFPQACLTQDDDLRTPLHLACDSSCELFEDSQGNCKRGPPTSGVVKALLEGSKEAATLDDIDDMNALEYAIISDAPIEVVKLLQRVTRDQSKKNLFDSPPESPTSSMLDLTSLTL